MQPQTRIRRKNGRRMLVRECEPCYFTPARRDRLQRAGHLAYDRMIIRELERDPEIKAAHDRIRAALRGE